MQFCCNGLTLSERNISTITSPLETEITFNKKALHERFHCIVYWWHFNSAQNIYINAYNHVRCIIALSNQNTLILKCVDSVNSKRSFKSVKSVPKQYYFLPQCLISHKNILTTYIGPYLNNYAVVLTRNCDDMHCVFFAFSTRIGLV